MRTETGNVETQPGINRRRGNRLPDSMHDLSTQVSFDENDGQRNNPLVAVGSRFLCIAIAILVLLAARPFWAQSTGVILGTVKDPSGAVIPKAKVTVVNTDTNDMRMATTADDGTYRFSALGTGHYSVKVEKEGFATQTETGLNLEVAQQLVANLALQVGTSRQSVTVTEQVQLVDTTNAELGGMVGETKIAELPLNGRNYTDLTYMEPGITENPSINSSSQQGGLHGTGFNADGLLVRQNTYLIDGAPMIAARGIGPVSESGTSIGVAGIKEFKVVTGAFDASYGMVPGGHVIIASKGGSNGYHGEAFGLPPKQCLRCH